MSRSWPLPPRRLLALLLLLATPAPGLAWPVGPVADGPAADPYQLLANPGLEIYDPPYGTYEGVPCQVAGGWQRFWLDGAEPAWMDDRVFAFSHLGTGWVDCIEGETSQLIFATEPYTAGLRQSVAVTPGVGYGFHAALLSIFQTSAQPPEHGTMLKQVGIDPTGGTDPRSAAVVWSEADDWDQGPWRVDLRAAAFSQAPTVTVFIQMISPYPSGDPSLLNLGFLDSALLARTPIITATSPAASDVPAFGIAWDNAVPAPGLGAIKWRDVQWLDEAEGVWHDWITRTYSVEASFTGEWGHAYRFRARVWQRYENGAHLASPYRAAGDTRTAVRGPSLVGLVLSHDGQAVGGARIAVPDTPYATLSGGEGRYTLGLAAWSAPEVITVSHPTRPAPPGLYGVQLGLTDTLPFTWTLRPPDDAVTNGQLEDGLDGWHTLGLTPTLVAEPVHTGRGAVALSGPAGVTFTAGLSQSLVLTHTWEPALSLWYDPAGTGDRDHFSVAFSLVTGTVSPTLPLTLTRTYSPALTAPGWVHLALPVGLADTYTSGTATIEFRFWHRPVSGTLTATLVLDEIALGATPGGPYRAYLPLVLNRRR